MLAACVISARCRHAPAAGRESSRHCDELVQPGSPLRPGQRSTTQLPPIVTSAITENGGEARFSLRHPRRLICCFEALCAMRSNLSTWLGSRAVPSKARRRVRPSYRVGSQARHYPQGVAAETGQAIVPRGGATQAVG